MSDASTVTSFGDISVCEEIGQLINRCQQLEHHIHTSYETLQSIHFLVENHKNIIITYNGWIGDFDELLEQFHNKALTSIKENGTNNFGESLLTALETIQFN